MDGGHFVSFLKWVGLVHGGFCGVEQLLFCSVGPMGSGCSFVNFPLYPACRPQDSTRLKIISLETPFGFPNPKNTTLSKVLWGGDLIGVQPLLRR